MGRMYAAAARRGRTSAFCESARQQVGVGSTQPALAFAQFRARRGLRVRRSAGPVACRRCIGRSPNLHGGSRALLTAGFRREQNPSWLAPDRTRRPVFRESSSELMIDRSLASRAVRMQLTGPACLGKTPARRDCPVALVLASCALAHRRALRSCLRDATRLCSSRPAAFNRPLGWALAPGRNRERVPTRS